HERGQDAGDLHTDLSVGGRARVGGLSGPASALIRLAAVWGRALSVADAGAVLGSISEAQVGILAREGVDNGLLGSADGEVFFPHDLVREAVYADIPPGDRRALHRACARYIVGDGRSALAASPHFRACAVRDDEEAVDALVNVQRDADALAVAERLLAVADEPEIVARIELQACRGLWCAGEYVQMERRAAGALARDGVSPVLRAQLSAAQALAASRTLSAARTKAMAQAALADGHRLDDMYSQRLAVVAMIEAARNEGRHRLALDHFTDLRRLSDTAYEAEEIRTLQHLDRYDDAEAMLAKIREAHDELDHQLPSMLYAQMWQDHNLARLDAAEAGARTLLTLADETGNYGFRLNARMVLGAV